MGVLRALILGLAAILAAAALADAPPEPGRAVWFGLHFIDTSAEGAINGIRTDETARIAMAEDFIAADLAARGFTLLRPPADRIAGVRNPARSNGLDSAIAAEMGADYAISGEVQKVSNLILSLNLRIREAGSGRTLRTGAVDIRGNTDESFRRGYRYLLKNLIFRADQGGSSGRPAAAQSSVPPGNQATPE